MYILFSYLSNDFQQCAPWV